MESLFNFRVPEFFLNNFITLDDMVAETIDVMTEVEQETLDEIYRGVIAIPHLQNSMKAMMLTPEDLFGF